jgi:hypothetical protein
MIYTYGNLVPVKFIFEVMGCTMLWNGKMQVVYHAKNFKMMILSVVKL